MDGNIIENSHPVIPDSVRKIPAHITKKGWGSHFKHIVNSFFVNLSQNTRTEYEHVVYRFFSFLKERNFPIQAFRDIQRYHIVYYKNFLVEKGFSNKTILKHLSALSSMIKFLANDGLVDKDTVFGVRRPKTQNKKETLDFTDAEVKKIFNSFDPKSQYYTSHRAILAVGFYTGLRTSEIRNLRLRDIGMIHGHYIIKVLIKGGKIHEIPLNPFVIKCLEEHLNFLKAEGFQIEDENHYLFPPLKKKENKPIEAAAFYLIFKKRLKRAGVEGSGIARHSPHSMRATFAGHLLNTVEAPLEEVQRLMGHSSPTTTQKYNKRKKSHDKSPVYMIRY